MSTEGQGNQEAPLGQKVYDWLLGLSPEERREQEQTRNQERREQERREQELTSKLGPLVGLTCDEALEQATLYITSRGASVAYKTDNSVSFVRSKGVNPVAFLFLLLLFIVPAIIYAAIMSGAKEHFTITATPAPGGCRLRFGGDYGAGSAEYGRWLRKAPGPNPSITYPKDTGGLQEEGDAPLDIPTQIRKLAELRDAGILSEEEFQTKKRDLLDRL
jgi:putative oligomerization/nucleic acid binding protein